MHCALARHLLALFACMVLTQSLASNAEAQSYPVSLRIAPELALVAGRGATRTARDLELHVAQRRARWLMTIGSGMIAGAIVGLGVWQLDDPGCDPDGSEPLYMPGVGAALFAAGGAALLAGGIVKINGVPIGYRREYPLTAGRILAIVGGAVLAGALASGGVLGVGYGQWITCANS